MGNFTVLGGLIIKLIVVGLPIIFLILLFRKRNNQFTTAILILIILLTTGYAIYFFISAQKRKTETSRKYLGYYKLNRLDCKDCDNCKIKLHPDNNYDIIQNETIIGKGKWDLEFNPETGYFLKIENGPGGMIYDTPREIESIDRKNCCIEGCKDNLLNEFSGRIVDIRIDGYHFNQKTIFIRKANGDTIKYFPKYYSHPWIEDDLQIGDVFTKEKQTMNFTVVNSKGDTTFLNYKTPNCESECPKL